MTAAPANRSVSRLVDVIVRRRGVFFLLVLCSLLPAWGLARQLQFDQSIESLYANDNPQLARFRQSRRWFGGDEFVIVAWRDPDLFAAGSRELTPAAETRIREFSRSLSLVPGVNPDSTQSLARLHAEQKLDFGLFQREMKVPRDRMHAVMRKTLLGEDDQTTAIVLRLRPLVNSSNAGSSNAGSGTAKDDDSFLGIQIPPTTLDRRTTIAAIRRVAEGFAREHSVEVAVAGEPVQVDDMFRYVEDDGRTLFRVSLVLLAGVLLLLFRSVKWVLLPLLVVVSAILWTEAVLVLADVPLSMVSPMLNSLVTIVGIATVTHFVVRFRDRQRVASPGDSRGAVVRRVCGELVPPVFWTCTTTAVGFGALLCSSIAPVRSFALMMSLATGCVFLAVLLLVPLALMAGGLRKDGGGAAGGGVSAESAITLSDRLAEALSRLAGSIDRRHRARGGQTAGRQGSPRHRAWSRSCEGRRRRTGSAGPGWGGSCRGNRGRHLATGQRRGTGHGSCRSACAA